jgi:hypothetical protein
MKTKANVRCEQLNTSLTTTMIYFIWSAVCVPVNHETKASYFSFFQIGSRTNIANMEAPPLVQIIVSLTESYTCYK